MSIRRLNALFHESLLLSCSLSILTAAGCVQSIPRLASQGAHVVLYTDLQPDERAAEMLKEADRSVREISELLGLAPPVTPAKVLLFGSRSALRSYLDKECPQRVSAAAACFETAGTFVVALSERWRTSETLRYLRHELSHYVTASHFYDIPPWMDEGLAQFFELGPPYPRPHPACLKALSRHLRRRKEGILTELISIPQGTGLSHEQYGQAWGLVFFLMTDSETGPTSVRRYLEKVRMCGSPDEQFREAFGRGPAEIEPAWRERILRLAKTEMDTGRSLPVQRTAKPAVHDD